MENYAELMGEWLNEKVVKTPYHNWIYQIVCFLMFRWRRKLTYKDLFLLLYGVNRNKVGDRQAKEISLYKVIEIYQANNNNKLPKGIKI